MADVFTIYLAVTKDGHGSPHAGMTSPTLFVRANSESTNAKMDRRTDSHLSSQHRAEDLLHFSRHTREM